VSEIQEAASGSFGARATDLRRAVNASRVRLDEQRREAERLRAELAELLKRAAEAPAPRMAAPAAAKTVSDSARVGAVSGAAGRRRTASLALPIAALALFIAGQQAGLALQRPAPTDPAPAPAEPTRPPLPPLEAALATTGATAADEGAEKALLLAAAWREPQDGLTLDERFGPAVDLPGVAATWEAERTDERSYRVTRRAPNGDEYAFDVDLSLGRVVPETRLGPSPQYVAMGRPDDALREP